MKKVNLLAVFAVVLVLIIVVIIAAVVLNDDSTEANDYALLKYTSAEEIEDYIKDNKIENHFTDETSCWLENITVFNKTANIEYQLSEGSVLMTKVDFVVFQCLDEKASDEELESINLLEYSFTDKDKKAISKEYEELLSSFGKMVECELEQYDTVPAYDNNFKDTDEDFYKGLFIKQYSVRDASGVLWLVSLEARYGSAYATVSRVNDESAYEGFIPIIDMTKN